MVQQRQSRLPWVLLAIAIGGAAYAGLLAAQKAERAREAKREADIAADSAATLLEGLREANARIPLLVDSLNAHWAERLDSLSALPPEIPATDPRIQALLDTAEMNRDLRAAVDAITSERNQLRIQNQGLRTQIVDLRAAAAQAVDSVNAFWAAKHEQTMRVVSALEIGLAKSREEADRWEVAYYASRMSWWDRVKWGAGGVVVGYALNEFTGGSSVNINSCSDYC